HTRFSRDWSSDVCSSDLLFQVLQESLSLRQVIRIIKLFRHYYRGLTNYFVPFNNTSTFGIASSYATSNTPLGPRSDTNCCGVFRNDNIFSRSNSVAFDKSSISFNRITVAIKSSFG